jgi:hypothetical protein
MSVLQIEQDRASRDIRILRMTEHVGQTAGLQLFKVLLDNSLEPRPEIGNAVQLSTSR